LPLIASAHRCAIAAAPLIPAKKHAWGKFEPGAWKKVRVITTTFDESGQETSHTSLIETTLEASNEMSYRLVSQVETIVGGKSLPNEPQRIEQTYTGTDEEGLKKVRDEILEIDGVKFNTQVYEIISEEPLQRRVTTLYFHPDNPPYVLKRDVAVTDKNTEQVINRTEIVVTSLNKPIEVLNIPQVGWQVKIVQHQADLTMTTVEVHCADVPGSLVSHNMLVTDKSDRIVRHTRLEVIDFDVKSQNSRQVRRFGTRIREHFQRKRNRRAGGGSVPNEDDPPAPAVSIVGFRTVTD
jgi:hypothetical protein